jgi:hypothetical protein
MKDAKYFRALAKQFRRNALETPDVFLKPIYNIVANDAEKLADELSGKRKLQETGNILDFPER